MTKIKALEQALGKVLGAERTKFDQMTRALYSTDASNYQIMPICVTFPRHADEVSAIHEISAQYQVSLLPRGGGSSLAGQTVNEAIIMDFSRELRTMRSIHAEEQTVQVDAGMVLGQMNAQLQPLGLMFGPDPASADRATLGGCIGNNATGSHSILYGMTADHIRRLEVVLANGERHWLDAKHPTLDALRAEIAEIIRANQDEIAARYPKTWRTVAGYPLNKIDPAQVDLSQLFAGSEGTLGTILRAELNLTPYYPPHKRRLTLLHFESLRAALEATPRILEVAPSAIELMDRFLLNKTRQHHEYSRYLDFITGDPAAVLVVEFYGESESELLSKADNLRALLQKIGYQGEITHATRATDQAKVWKIRKAGLGLLLSQRGDNKPIAFVEDATVPVEHLADYIDRVDAITKEAGTDYAIYAHASAGCLHVRPLINLKSEDGRRQYRQIAEAVTAAVLSFDGTITGEHGQGIARGEFGVTMFGEKLSEAFRAVKRLFDPQNRMNPGKIIDCPPMDDPRLMRYSPNYEVIPLNTRYDWSDDGGLGGAVEMCNGSGVCRKEHSGTMCPSYMATRDEAHATRGRANALRLAISGHLPDGLGNKALKEVYDLCLACKSCSAECPSSVDVAKMKAEFLGAYYDQQGTPFTARLFGNVHRLNAWMSLAPPLANFMLSNSLALFGARLMGIPTERPLPKLAMKRFSHLAKKHQPRQPAAWLVIDTFTEYNHPEIGWAVLQVAQKLGLEIGLLRLPASCCGRPAISKGLMDQAKHMANHNVIQMSAEGRPEPYLFLEPSCLSAFTDDYLTLVDPNLQSDAHHLAEHCLSVESWFAQQISQGNPQWDDSPRHILLHGHCHQKALWGTDSSLALLRSIPNTQIEEIDDGCCGVAGSFGYEHYELSMTIAEDRLLPTIRANPQAIIAAPGTSCRAQIMDAGYSVRHPIEIIAEALR